MKIIEIDKLNTLLILISFVLAYIFPFELFIIVYAILGPLHYFTEINWIKEKNYFVTSKKWIYCILIFSLLISLPGILKTPLFESFKELLIIKSLRNNLPKFNNHFFLLALFLAFSFLFFKKRKQQILIFLLGVVAALLVHQYSLYHIIIGILLPTIIHVYVFTILFMWYGNLNKKSTYNYLNIGLMISIPFILIFISIDNSSYQFSETMKSIFIDNFYKLNTSILNFLGVETKNQLFFYEIVNLKIQIFIAFAYTYHYLNWFSKTTVIGWHKKITQKKSILILFLWILSIGIYLYDYNIGLSILLFLSLLHVIMEFPLNILCLKKIIQSIFKPNKLLQKK
ncbi:hypothetical protein FIA58_015355 [Flavobacterium jejuense]|uniref:Beta-carotene 15,15'-monooxygenase n=1 Tax=Flavobacterium jejuense TaxID=1544455 RepID=A0ABX0IZB7_9FLAO|nr:hypothetical protein [Flavobacterium jejuense]NHN27060.1 hypothetical protein [Flavobacterium jejuense]